MTTRTRLSVLLISTPLVAFIVFGGMMGKASGGDQTFQHLRIFEDVVSLILNNYVEEAKVDRVMEGAMRGLADGLDPDSAYLTAAQVKLVDPGEKPAAGDVGVELTRQYYLRVIAARDESPAAKAGLQTGDYVRAIDGRPARDMSVFEGMRMLRGAPGTKVTLTIIRGNAAEPRQIELVREKTPGAIVTGRMLPGDLGYLRIAAFGPDATAKIRAQATELQKAGAKHLIVDVRRTAEGPFESGIDAARLFVKTGTLAMVAGRDPKATPPPSNPQTSRPAAAEPPARVSQESIKETIAAKAGDGAIALPVTLLVTTGTSGAAELFAAALDGNTRADLVGERTLGRAGIQKLVRLPDGRGLWLTYARYLTPGGEIIQGRGLTPDLAVDEPDVDFDQQKPATDPVLDAAVARIQKNG
ncbi:MAG TPA: S41 family peptidase [Vicinamibacterales bacterium]|nr:S41 family peptidase [Vicinamibacterales bacterium]